MSGRSPEDLAGYDRKLLGDGKDPPEETRTENIFSFFLVTVVFFGYLCLFNYLLHKRKIINENLFFSVLFLSFFLFFYNLSISFNFH